MTRRVRSAFVVGSTSGGQNSDISVSFGGAAGPTGAANNDATSRSRTPLMTSKATRVRATFQAAAGSALAADNVAIGVWDGVAAKADTLLTPIELLFAGLSGFSIAAGAKVTSDWALVSGITVGSSLVVILDYAAANGNAVASVGNATPAASYIHAAANSFSTTVTPAGSTEVVGGMFDVVRIEFN